MSGAAAGPPGSTPSRRAVLGVMTLAGVGASVRPAIAAPPGPAWTAADVAAMSIDPATDAIRTSGHARAGDGGAALYIRVPSEPSHSGRIRSRDGAWWELRETRLSLAMLGYRADARHDGTRWVGTDNLPVWRAALVVCRALSIGEIIVPHGETGRGLVSGAIVDGDLPSGLTISGEGPNSGGEHEAGTTILFTGTGTCWAVRPQGQAPREAGRWRWRDLCFWAIDPAATLFDLNDTLSMVDPDRDPRPFIVHATFERCTLLGADRPGQRGDGLRATKAFHIVVDANCTIKGWRRGIWLRGCDNPTIAARLTGNGQNLRLEALGTFGSMAMIESRFIGPTKDCGEPQYCVFDAAYRTTLNAPFLEGDDKPAALIYLAGQYTQLIGVTMAGGPLFHLAPSAREIVVRDPVLNRADPRWAPIVDPPESWDFGYAQAQAFMTVTGEDAAFTAVVPPHPRIQRAGDTQVMSPLAYRGRSAGTLSSGGIARIEKVAGGRWAVRIAAGKPQAGFTVPLPAMPTALVIEAQSLAGTGWRWALLDAAGRGLASGPVEPGAGWSQTEITRDQIRAAASAVTLAIYGDRPSADLLVAAVRAFDGDHSSPPR